MGDLAIRPDTIAFPAFNAVAAVGVMRERHNALVQITKDVLREGIDFGVVGGVSKPSLLKPGAEKLNALFALSPEFTIVEKLEAWEAPEPFFFYLYKCRLIRDGRVWGEGDGSCNSRESKYRYRWVSDAQVPDGVDKKRLVSKGGIRKLFEFKFSLEKRETTGQYGKPEQYWQAFDDAIAQGTARVTEKAIKSGEKRPGLEISINETLYRVANPDIADQVNTVCKMAQKRALVAATLIATGASEFFTQDVEDMEILNNQGYAVATATAETHEEVRDRRVAEERAKLDALKSKGESSFNAQPVGAPWATLKERNERFAAMKVQLGDDLYGRCLRAHNADGGKFADNKSALQCYAEMSDLLATKGAAA